MSTRPSRPGTAAVRDSGDGAAWEQEAHCGPTPHGEVLESWSGHSFGRTMVAELVHGTDTTRPEGALVASVLGWCTTTLDVGECRDACAEAARHLATD